jgi:CubicO group peptidase (beta-lactamase class C family)
MAAWEELDATLRGWVDERDLSGIALVTRGGKTEFEGCYGLANRGDNVPVRPGTRFGIASVGKMFTAVTIADLVRAGRLGFDTAVVEVLPPPRRPSTLRADVTVGHLLSHTSGIADYAEEDEQHPARVEYAEIWRDRPTYMMRRPADYLPIFGDRPPYWPPGERFHYCNAGYVLLALVIEEVTGLSFVDAVDAAVFSRAGMADSGYFALDEVRPDIATGYIRPAEPGGLWRSNIYTIPVVGSGDGGPFASAGDLSRFLTAYDDGTLLGELRDEMLAPRCRWDGGDMGYGVFVYDDPRGARWGHGGGDDGVAVLIHRLPDLDVNVIAMCNVNGVIGDLRDALVEAVVGPLPDRPA